MQTLFKTTAHSFHPWVSPWVSLRVPDSPTGIPLRIRRLDTGFVHPNAVGLQESHCFSLITTEQALAEASLGARPVLGPGEEPGPRNTISDCGTKAERPPYLGQGYG